jgi:tripeptidyl-peptidase-1
MVKPNGTVYEPEMACMETIYSSGGFSNYFAMPEYQKDAVNYYLTNYYPDYPSTIWNSTGTVGLFSSAASHADESFQSRAFPDISANGANYVIAVCGQICF